MTRIPETEAGFQRSVIDLAHYNGWIVAHFRRARVQRKNGTAKVITPVGADGAGFPDLVLVRDRTVFAELKTDRGIVSPDQQVWHAHLRAAEAEFHVWRPSDWAQIEEVLARSAR